MGIRQKTMGGVKKTRGVHRESRHSFAKVSCGIDLAMAPRQLCSSLLHKFGPRPEALAWPSVFQFNPFVCSSDKPDRLGVPDFVGNLEHALISCRRTRVPGFVCCILSPLDQKEGELKLRHRRQVSDTCGESHITEPGRSAVVQVPYVERQQARVPANFVGPAL